MANMTQALCLFFSFLTSPVFLVFLLLLLSFFFPSSFLLLSFFFPSFFLSSSSSSLNNNNNNKQNKDTHIAVDHLLLGLLAEAEREVRDAIISSETGLTEKKLSKAIADIRKNKAVHTDQAEDAWDALNQYAHDLVAKAEAGKLDPVIGRDEEIRRVIQVLSRRTKNNPILV